MLCNDYGEVRASGFLVWPRVPSGWVLPWIGDMGGMRTLDLHICERVQGL